MPIHDIAASIAKTAQAEGWRVGAAESLTGGAVSSALAAAPQAADWYAGSLVAYGEHVKHDVLGVTPGPLVSERCATEMVRGVAGLLQVDAALATTGAGGPEPEEGEPPGTVFVAVLAGGELTTRRLDIDGDPQQVVERSTEQSLTVLLDALRAR